MVDTVKNYESGLLASLSPEALDKLAELVVAKLVARDDRSCFPSKTSWVRIPSPAPRSFLLCLTARLTFLTLPSFRNLGLPFAIVFRIGNRMIKRKLSALYRWLRQLRHWTLRRNTQLLQCFLDTIYYATC